jgi:hypothetical protein
MSNTLLNRLRSRVIELVAPLVGLFITAIGLLGVVAPRELLTVVRSIQTPLGLCLVAALRVIFGLVLVLVAPSSRAPRVLRLLGFTMFVAGLITPLIGVDRARAILDWWSNQGPAFMRVWAGLAVALGTFVVYAVAPHRRAA